jgi:hypothetical protein
MAPPWQRAPGVASQYADGTSCGQPAGAERASGHMAGRRLGHRRVLGALAGGLALALWADPDLNGVRWKGQGLP